MCGGMTVRAPSNLINFVQDLPYFLILLFAFQRFTMDDWIVISTFHSSEQGNQLIFKSPSVPAIEVVIEKTARCITIVGSLGVQHVLCTRAATCLIPQKVAGLELVLKICWQEASWVLEGQIIEKARKTWGM
jgi:hypothetical protein